MSDRPPFRSISAAQLCAADRDRLDRCSELVWDRVEELLPEAPDPSGSAANAAPPPIATPPAIAEPPPIADLRTEPQTAADRPPNALAFSCVEAFCRMTSRPVPIRHARWLNQVRERYGQAANTRRAHTVDVVGG